MNADGKVRVVVRSRRVPVRSFSWQTPVYSASGVLQGSETRQGTVYESVLDAPHVRAIEEARRLSNSTGLELEIVDLGRQSLLKRLVGGVLERGVASSLPEIRMQVPNPAGVSSQLEPLARALA
jgi:hypothetical protein